MVDGRHVATEHNGHDASSQPRPSKRGRGTSPPPNGTESTPAKRSRVSRACDQCRASREKCDGVKPVCHTCNSQKRACTYDEPPKKRGIQPNYIRTLELTLAWLFQTVPETQTALSKSLPVLNGPAQRCVSLLILKLLQKKPHAVSFRVPRSMDSKCSSLIRCYPNTFSAILCLTRCLLLSRSFLTDLM